MRSPLLDEVPKIGLLQPTILQSQRYLWVSSCHNVPFFCKISSNKGDQEYSRPLNRILFPKETLPQEDAMFFVRAISTFHSQTIPGFISRFFRRNVIPLFAQMSPPLYSTEFLLLCEHFFWADAGELFSVRGQPSSWEVQKDKPLLISHWFTPTLFSLKAWMPFHSSHLWKQSAWLLAIHYSFHPFSEGNFKFHK